MTETVGDLTPTDGTQRRYSSCCNLRIRSDSVESRGSISSQSSNQSSVFSESVTAASDVERRRQRPRGTPGAGLVISGHTDVLRTQQPLSTGRRPFSAAQPLSSPDTQTKFMNGHLSSVVTPMKAIMQQQHGRFYHEPGRGSEVGEISATDVQLGNGRIVRDRGLPIIEGNLRLFDRASRPEQLNWSYNKSFAAGSVDGETSDVRRMDGPLRHHSDETGSPDNYSTASKMCPEFGKSPRQQVVRPCYLRLRSGSLPCNDYKHQRSQPIANTEARVQATRLVSSIVRNMMSSDDQLSRAGACGSGESDVDVPCSPAGLPPSSPHRILGGQSGHFKFPSDLSVGTRRLQPTTTSWGMRDIHDCSRLNARKFQKNLTSSEKDLATISGNGYKQLIAASQFGNFGQGTSDISRNSTLRIHDLASEQKCKREQVVSAVTSAVKSRGSIVSTLSRGIDTRNPSSSNNKFQEFGRSYNNDNSKKVTRPDSLDYRIKSYQSPTTEDYRITGRSWRVPAARPNVISSNGRLHAEQLSDQDNLHGRSLNDVNVSFHDDCEERLINFNAPNTSSRNVQALLSPIDAEVVTEFVPMKRTVTCDNVLLNSGQLSKQVHNASKNMNSVSSVDVSKSLSSVSKFQNSGVSFTGSPVTAPPSCNSKSPFSGAFLSAATQPPRQSSLSSLLDGRDVEKHQQQHCKMGDKQVFVSQMLINISKTSTNHNLKTHDVEHNVAVAQKIAPFILDKSTTAAPTKVATGTDKSMAKLEATVVTFTDDDGKSMLNTTNAVRRRDAVSFDNSLRCVNSNNSKMTRPVPDGGGRKITDFIQSKRNNAVSDEVSLRSAVSKSDLMKSGDSVSHVADRTTLSSLTSVNSPSRGIPSASGSSSPFSSAAVNELFKALNESHTSAKPIPPTVLAIPFSSIASPTLTPSSGPQSSPTFFCTSPPVVYIGSPLVTSHLPQSASNSMQVAKTHVSAERPNHISAVVTNTLSVGSHSSQAGSHLSRVGVNSNSVLTCSSTPISDVSMSISNQTTLVSPPVVRFTHTVSSPTEIILTCPLVKPFVSPVTSPRTPLSQGCLTKAFADRMALIEQKFPPTNGHIGNYNTVTDNHGASNRVVANKNAQQPENEASSINAKIKVNHTPNDQSNNVSLLPLLGLPLNSEIRLGEIRQSNDRGNTSINKNESSNLLKIDSHLCKACESFCSPEDTYRVVDHKELCAQQMGRYNNLLEFIACLKLHRDSLKSVVLPKIEQNLLSYRGRRVDDVLPAESDVKKIQDDNNLLKLEIELLTHEIGLANIGLVTTVNELETQKQVRPRNGDQQKQRRHRCVSAPFATRTPSTTSSTLASTLQLSSDNSQLKLSTTQQDIAGIKPLLNSCGDPAAALKTGTKNTEDISMGHGMKFQWSCAVSQAGSGTKSIEYARGIKAVTTLAAPVPSARTTSQGVLRSRADRSSIIGAGRGTLERERGGGNVGRRGVSEARGVREVAARWKCRACTFLNHSALVNCELCDMPRIEKGAG